MKNMNRSIVLAITFTLNFLCLQAQDNQKVFDALIKTYAESINKADTIIASKFWSKAEEASFINPRSTEYGWAGVKNIYKMFAENFGTRDLKYGKTKVSVYGTIAWLTFQWVFDATFKDGTPMQTKGRETQIWRKEKKEWKLVHIHYSGLPLSGEREGF